VTVRYRDGHCSVHHAARILRCRYGTVLKLIARGELRGGRYARLKKHGRFVDMASVLRLHQQKLKDQVRRFVIARQH
jgi:hypothetical protein